MCQPAVPCRQNPNVCDDNAQCLPFEIKPHHRTSTPLRNQQTHDADGFACKCKDGFLGDGFDCESNTILLVN